MNEFTKPDTPRNRGDYDAPHLSVATPAEDIRTIMLNRVSWGAVLAGVFVALVAQLLLNLLGVGVGASTFHVSSTANNPSVSALSTGAAAWWVVSGIIAAFLGGVTAGRLSGKPKEGTAAWHGLTTWALTTLVIFWLLSTTLGTIAGGGLNIVGNALSGTGNAAGGAIQTAAQAAAPSIAASPDPFGGIESRIRSATGSQDPAAMRDAAVAAVKALVTGDPAQADAARTRAADALAKAQNIPPDQALAQVRDYEQQYRQAVDTAKQKATAAAEAARKTVARGSIMAFIALLLGALAGWFGGRLGAVEPTLTLGRARV